jgi:hypothetical protein
MAKTQSAVLALFKEPAYLKQAAEKIRKLSITKTEAYTPFAVHGLEKAMGIKKSRISVVTLVMGLAGCALGFFFQVWTSAVDWPINVGGKPLISWPAFIPITFETTILIGGVVTTLALYAICRLPNFNPKILDPRLTNDHFGLWIDESDPNYKAIEVETIFKECNAVEIKKI